MHPAHTLSTGDTQFAAGASASFALGPHANAINAADAEAINVTTNNPTETYSRGALAAAAIAPGVAPFVSGRVGLDHNIEGGFAYAGRIARVDGRFAWQTDSTALSIGVGASALLSRRGASPNRQIASLDLDETTGWGLDMPILFGWRSAADFVWLWSGIRGGYDRLLGSVGYVAAGPESTIDGDISGSRSYVMGLFGLAVGFRYLHASVELSGGYSLSKGTLWGTEVEVRGFSISPATALLFRF